MTYIRLIGGRYVFRRRVPTTLQERARRKELVRSIGSCSFGEARNEARRLAVASDRFFAMLKSASGLTEAQIEELARTWFVDKVAADERRLAHLQPEDPDDVQAEARRASREAEGSRELLRINDWRAASEIAHDLLESSGISLGEGDPAFRSLCRSLLRAYHEAARLYASRHDGDYGARPADLAFSLSRSEPMVETGRTASAVQGPTSEEPGLTIASLIELHVAHEKPRWTNQTLKQNEMTFRLFAERHGGERADALTRRAVSQFIADLRTLPSKWGQTTRYQNKSFSEMLLNAKKENPGIPRLSQKTINRHLSSLSGLFSWGKKHGYFNGDNPATGFIDKRTDGKNKNRRPWTPEEIAALFSSPVWRGCAGERHRAKPGPKIIRDSKYWLPLIALHSGMRLEEIAKMRAEDVRQDGDIWLFDVLGNEAGRVKEAASNRTVPMHPALVRWGLTQHVQAIRAAGGGSLWPELKPGGPDKKYSDAFTRWFGRYCTEIGLKKPELVFHGFRHTFATELHAQGTNESIVSDILGHEHKSMSYKTYSRGAPVRPLHDAISLIDYGIKF